MAEKQIWSLSQLTDSIVIARLNQCISELYVWGFHCMVVQIVVFWVVTPCSLVGRYQHLEGTYCFHLQGQSMWGKESVELYKQDTKRMVTVILGRWRGNRTYSRPIEMVTRKMALLQEPYILICNGSTYHTPWELLWTWLEFKVMLASRHTPFTRFLHKMYIM
jgi:hypothetical protein